jgi:hypothetical protein
MTALYVDLEGIELLEETWETRGGVVELVSQRPMIQDGDFRGPG